jgi:CubicO group peptidase (beta-lactamase class C family)
MLVNHKSSVLFLLFFAAFLPVCFGQVAPLAIIRGIIVNDSTREPIDFATVRVSNNGISVISNDRGRFILKLPAGAGADSVIVSHVGYRAAKFPIAKSDTGFRVIRLREEVDNLAEVVVRTMNPLNIIKGAIEKIPDNYPMRPYLLHGFYRYTGKKEDRIINLSEAVFDIYNENYARKNKQLKLIKSRFDIDFATFNGRTNIRIGHTPAGIIDDDIICQAGKSGLLSAEGLKEHQFYYKGIINYNGRKAYEIQFDQQDGIKKMLYRGRLFIDVNSLAFLECDLGLSPKGIKYWEPGLGKKLEFLMLGLKYTVVQGESVITYREYGGKYYLDQVRGRGILHFEGVKDHLDINPFRTSSDYVVTGIDTTDVRPFSKDELIKEGRFIENDPGDSTEDDFWKSYNLILPNFNVDSVARSIRAANGAEDLKRVLSERLSKCGKDRSDRIDSILSFYYAKGQFTGTALIQTEGKVICDKGFGLANREEHLRNTPTTQFRIGSMSKQFTAMLIMQLVNENRLSVSDSVGKFIPGYSHGKVTIRQLLTHQSGIPNYTDNLDYRDSIFMKAYPADQLVRLFCSDSLEFEPGTQFRYSNSGYVVLADIIEKVTGKNYADVLQERIFRPLGMSSSYFRSAGPGVAGQAIGYVDNQREYPYHLENVIGAGGITSTAEDLLLWANALSTDKLLPKDKISELFEPRVEWPAWDAYYGYGWMTDRYLFEVSKKHTIQYHPGTDIGFYSMLVLQSDKNAVIILLNNAGEFPRFDMTDFILKELN